MDSATGPGLRVVFRCGAESGNLLIHGENLLAMRALLPGFAETVKLVYIDPPFNTGGRSAHYRDRMDSAAWLAMMEERLRLLRLFLRPDGVIFVHLDDAEMAYCKVAMDGIFGRENYITTIVVKAATPSSFKTVNPGPVAVAEYLLMYCRDRSSFRYEPQYLPVEGVDLRRFSRYILNPEDPPEAWRFGSVVQAALAAMGFNGPPEEARRRAEQALGREAARAALARQAEQFALANAERVFETKTLQRPGRHLAEAVARSKAISRVMRVARDGRPDLYLYRGRQLYFLSRSTRVIGGRRAVVQPLPNLWTDIPTSSLFTEGGVDFRTGKKPERLLARIIEMATAPGDYVLDAFAGSGTTGAAAHKLGRRWIMIEEGPQAETHAAVRLKRVVEGADRSGITEAAGWEGGGGFLFCRLEEGEEDGCSAPPPPPAAAGPPVVAAAVIMEEGRVLVAQRRENLLWEFPGGKLEPGEEAREALARELREELDVEIEVGRPLEVVTLPGSRSLVIIFFAARIVSGEPRPLECTAFRWESPELLGHLPMGEADRRMAALLTGEGELRKAHPHEGLIEPRS